MSNCIHITGVDLVKFATDVYDLSIPRSLEGLHFTKGPLPKEKAEELVAAYKYSINIALSMDYVSGRRCKMHVFRGPGNTLSITAPWFDHTDEELKQLLVRHNILINDSWEHVESCDCSICH